MPRTALLVIALLLSNSVLGVSRDNIHVVGSSTVFTFSKVVADRFARTTKFRGPNIEATGTGGGFKIFCQGVGAGKPDISNASRRIKRSEYQLCEKNGVKEIVEIPIGYDGIVLVNSRKSARLNLTPKEIYLALARRVPSAEDRTKLVDNPYKKWSEIDPALPDIPILVFGPPPSSGTRDSFVEMAMEAGCRSFPDIARYAKSKPKKFMNACHVLRAGPQFVEAGEQDNVIIEMVETNPGALGIMGFNYLDQNSHRVQGAVISGLEPTYDNINDHLYPISRPLYLYVKKAHVYSIPGMNEFLREFLSERAWGDDGYLSDRGLVPLEPDLRAEAAAVARSLKVMEAENL